MNAQELFYKVANGDIKAELEISEEGREVNVYTDNGDFFFKTDPQYTRAYEAPSYDSPGYDDIDVQDVDIWAADFENKDGFFAGILTDDAITAEAKEYLKAVISEHLNMEPPALDDNDYWHE